MSDPKKSSTRGVDRKLAKVLRVIDLQIETYKMRLSYVQPVDGGFAVKFGACREPVTPDDDAAIKAGYRRGSVFHSSAPADADAKIDGLASALVSLETVKRELFRQFPFLEEKA